MLDWFICPGRTEGIGGGNELSRLHPCPRSLAQVESLVLNFTLPGAKILDPFAGSGTTGVAVAKCGQGRKATLIEIDRDYCCLAEERMRQRR
jgi:site-specific DNA-methyltransferase (adenine-specific)